MTNAKMQAAANIIKDSALEFLAAKHGVSIDYVVAQIDAGNVKVILQFHALVKAGIAEALTLNDAGLISLA